MIFFACKSCRSIQGRPESASGAVVFCSCGHGNIVPWESTAVPPELSPPSLNCVEMPPEAVKDIVADEDACFNHPDRPYSSQCADCKEPFCEACLVRLKDVPLCGPCKNYRMNRAKLRRSTSNVALASFTLAVAGACALCLLGIFRSGGRVSMLLALVPCALGLVLGMISLRRCENDEKVGGWSLAMTGIVVSVVTQALFLMLFFHVPGPWS